MDGTRKKEAYSFAIVLLTLICECESVPANLETPNTRLGQYVGGSKFMDYPSWGIGADVRFPKNYKGPYLKEFFMRFQETLEKYLDQIVDAMYLQRYGRNREVIPRRYIPVLADAEKYSNNGRLRFGKSPVRRQTEPMDFSKTNFKSLGYGKMNFEKLLHNKVIPRKSSKYAIQALLKSKFAPNYKVWNLHHHEDDHEPLKEDHHEIITTQDMTGNTEYPLDTTTSEADNSILSAPATSATSPRSDIPTKTANDTEKSGAENKDDSTEKQEVLKNSQNFKTGPSNPISMINNASVIELTSVKPSNSAPGTYREKLETTSPLQPVLTPSKSQSKRPMSLFPTSVEREDPENTANPTSTSTIISEIPEKRTLIQDYILDKDLSLKLLDNPVKDTSTMIAASASVPTPTKPKSDGIEQIDIISMADQERSILQELLFPIGNVDDLLPLKRKSRKRPILRWTSGPTYKNTPRSHGSGMEKFPRRSEFHI